MEGVDLKGFQIGSEANQFEEKVECHEGWREMGTELLLCKFKEYSGQLYYLKDAYSRNLQVGFEKERTKKLIDNAEIIIDHIHDILIERIK